MKKSTKKGFTLVELVIVIAVIAILAAVLIPTFSGVIERANISADLQTLTASIESKYVEYVADNHDVPAGVTVKAEATTNAALFDDFSATSTLTKVVVKGAKGYAFTVTMVDGTYKVESLNEQYNRVIVTDTLVAEDTEVATSVTAAVTAAASTATNVVVNHTGNFYFNNDTLTVSYKVADESHTDTYKVSIDTDGNMTVAKQ